MRRFVALLCALSLLSPFDVPAFAQTVSPPAGGGGSGSVTSVTCNSGLTGGTFTTTGTCALDQTFAPTWTGAHTFAPAANVQPIQITTSLTGASTGIVGINFTTTLNTSGDPSCVFICATVTNTACGPNCNFINFPNVFTLNKNGQGTFGGNLLAGGNVVASNTGGTGSVGVAGTGCYNFVNSMFCSTAPTVSGTGVGTGPTITTNGTAAGQVTVGTTPSAATWTLTFIAAAHGWACSASDITTTSTSNFITKQVGGTTTTAVMESFTDVAVAGTYTAADKIDFQCTGF